MNKNILFITGTRADFGKQKPLFRVIQNHPDFNLTIFCTGMHLMSKYGYTVKEIQKSGFGNNLFHFLNQVDGESMEITLANTIEGLSRYLHENKVDLIVVHGDRVEAMAGAIAGALRNILVAHVEGGEVSGTIDDLIRHATTKMAHLHFVATDTAKNRLLQLGEINSSIFNIGSPDVDVMLSSDLPSIEEALGRYEIPFDDFSIAILHPVTTEIDNISKQTEIFTKSLIESDKNYIIIYPNNDLGSDSILKSYKFLEKNQKFKIFPSLRFEFFLTLLKNCNFIIGNSSAGIHEAPVYGIPSINLGSRQQNRFNSPSIINVDFIKKSILEAILTTDSALNFKPTMHYGKGDSSKRFIETLEKKEVWSINQQKKFVDLI